MQDSCRNSGAVDVFMDMNLAKKCLNALLERQRRKAKNKASKKRANKAKKTDISAAPRAIIQDMERILR